jgi:DNA-binding beta-propeller fold protein YncE
VVLDESGRLVRQFGENADTLDAPDALSEPGKFFGPRDIIVSGDEIYVVDTGNERVQVFALDGTFLRAWGGNGSAPSQLLEPVGIAIDGQGRIFIADSGNARISIFSSTGTPLEQWPVDAWVGNQYFEPYLAFDDAGNLYASSSATGSIEVFDPTGQPLPPITEVDGEQLEQPVGIEWSPQGTLLITDKGRSAAFQYVPPLGPGADENLGGLFDEVPATPEQIELASPITTSEGDLPIPAASPIASPEASPQPSPTPIGNG